MESCKVCNRETKYTCVWCRQVICNVCALSVLEETPGYNEETYSIGKCPEGKCCNIEDDGGNDDVTILAEEPPVKRAKVQRNVKSYFTSIGKKEENKVTGKAGSLAGSKQKAQSKQGEDKKSTLEKTKRSISVDTIKNNWIPHLLNDYKPEIWFAYENDGKHLTSMKCLMCEKYEASIDHIQGFNRDWISGTTNFRSSNIERHVKSKSHVKAMENHYIERNKIQNPKEEDQSTLENAFKGGEKKVWEQTKKKFEVSYFVVKEELPFTKYDKILDLEELHGVDIGASYRNDKACAEFVDYLGEDLDEKLAKNLEKANFYSVLSDGSTDCTVREQECTFVLYFDPKPMEEDKKGKVMIRMAFLGLKHLTSDKGGGKAEGVLRAITDSFDSLGITEFRSKLVGFGADGASVNMGNREGVIAFLRKELPWIIFNWCLSHRLELAVKEALNGTMFDVIDEMLLKIYYLYEKSPKKLSELACLKQELQHTFEFEEGGTKPVRSCGTRWIAHKLNAMRLIVDKFGLYMQHLESITRDKSYKPQMQSKVKGYLKTWKKPSILVHLCFYIDLLTPVAQLSLALQREEINPVNAIDAMDTIQKKLRRLKEKPFHVFKSINELKRKCTDNEFGEKVYQGFPLKFLAEEITNIAEKKKQRELGLISEVIEERLKDNDSYYLNLITEILNCKAWDRTKSKIDNAESDDENKENEYEEDIEFADDAISVLMTRFESPLKNAKASVSESGMLEEWHDLLEYAKKYLSPKSKPILKTWREIFDSERNFDNILKLVELCFVIPVSNAVVERFFSRMKRVKSVKRGSFSNERLEKVLRIGETGPPLGKDTVLSAMKLWGTTKQRRQNQKDRHQLKPRIEGRDLQDTSDNESSSSSDIDIE